MLGWGCQVNGRAPLGAAPARHERSELPCKIILKSNTATVRTPGRAGSARGRGVRGEAGAMSALDEVLLYLNDHSGKVVHAEVSAQLGDDGGNGA